MTKPQSIARTIVGSVLVVGLIAILSVVHGHFMAHSLDGNYPPSHWLIDGLSIALLLAFFRLVDGGIVWMARRRGWMEPTGKRLGVLLVRTAVGIAIFLPMGLSFVQLHPHKIATRKTPAEQFLAFEPFSVKADGLTLSGWYIPTKNDDPTKPIVLLTHGIGANKQNFLDYVYMVYGMGYSSVIFDFRAHGDSDGFWTSIGLAEAADVLAVVDWIHQRWPDRPIIGYGISMGGSAVLHAASERNPSPFRKIVIDNSFGRVERVAETTVLGHLGPLADFILWAGRPWPILATGVSLHDNNPEEVIGKLAGTPILILHSKRDRVIPVAEAIALYEATGKKAELVLFEQGGHSGNLDLPEYKQRVRDFLRSNDSELKQN